MSHSVHSPISIGAAPAEIDPVCGMRVDPARTPHQLEYQGRQIYFCSAGCRERFQKDPEHYLAAVVEQAAGLATALAAASGLLAQPGEAEA